MDLHAFDDFSVEVDKAGDAGPDTQLRRPLGNGVKIDEIVFFTSIFIDKKTNRIETPMDALRPKKICQRGQLPEPILQNRYMGLQKGVVRVDGEVEKEAVAAFYQSFAIMVTEKWAEILGPENNGMDLVGGGRHPEGLMGIGVDDVEVPLVDAFYEPGHVKGWDIGSTRGRKDHLRHLFLFQISQRYDLAILRWLVFRRWVFIIRW